MLHLLCIYSVDVNDASVQAWSNELMSLKLPKHLFLKFFPYFFFLKNISKIEENLLFILNFVTYDHVPYNHGSC